jgi:hypothetical protein
MGLTTSLGTPCEKYSYYQQITKEPTINLGIVDRKPKLGKNICKQ